MNVQVKAILANYEVAIRNTLRVRGTAGVPVADSRQYMIYFEVHPWSLARRLNAYVDVSVI